MICLRFTILLIIALAITSSQQVTLKPESDLNDSPVNILQTLKDIKELNAENAASFRKELSKQSDAIQQIKVQVTLKPESDLNDSLANILQTLKDIKESDAENAATFRKELQQIKLEQETMQYTSSKLNILLEGNRKSLKEISQQISNLADTTQQLQQKQSKVEEELNKIVYSLRFILDSSKPNLGKALISAVKNGDEKHVVFLLEFGAPIEYQYSQMNRPIHVAVLNGRYRILELLLENKANIESKGYTEKSALNIAGYSNCVECARILLDKGADIKSRDQWENTPIINPARVGYTEFVELLLERGADINDYQVEGVTALHWAARDGNLPIVTYLIKKGANTRMKTFAGKTPLDEAIAHEHYLVADYLRKLL